MTAAKEKAVQRTGYIVLTYVYEREGRRWVGRCEELGTAAFGRSLAEAQQRLTEAVLLHLNTLEDVGERERFFKENNIAFHAAEASSRLPRSVHLTKVPVAKGKFVQPHVHRLPEPVHA